MIIKNKKGFYEIEELKLPGLIHGFSTKTFGNMAYKYEEERQVNDNRRKFAQALEIDLGKVAQADLVHGTKVVVVKESGTAEGSDGLITNISGLPLLILTGDCAPYLFYDPQKKVIGLVHSGWKGTVGKIVLVALIKMVNVFGCEIEDVLIGIGPSIERCCYLNSRPNVEEFLPEWQNFIHNDDEKSASVNLNGFTIEQLLDVGVPRKNIFFSSFCTKDHHDEFYCSQRETAGLDKLGRFATVIQMT